MYDASSCAYDGADQYVYKFTGKERDAESGLDMFGGGNSGTDGTFPSIL
jgi:hypothetical protein